MCTYNIVRISADPKRSFKPEDLFHLAFDDELEDKDDNEALFEQGKLIRLPGIKYADA